MALGDLLRSIRRIEDLPRLAGALGYEATWRELPAASLGGTGPAALVGRSGGLEWYATAADRPGIAARVARGLLARGIPAALLVLDEGRRRLSVAAGDAPALDVSLDDPEPLDLARLARCAARPGESALAGALRIAEALAGRGVDQRFFAGFRRALAAAIAALPVSIPAADRHALALLQLTRILFLYFVEARGWLGGRPRFLREEVDRCLGARRSIHRDLLRPLFFGTLNRPWTERGALARRFGAVPYLNGGLFEPHPLERRFGASLPTPVLREVFDGLFERFHFTLGTPSGEAIAPDMLGRVFEGVMEPEERHASGTYYTPSALVEALVEEALATWLARRLRIKGPEARRRLEAPDARARQALAGLRLLDPAVGSGAFLLGALRLLAGRGPVRADRAASIRRILSANLFGVDRNGAAVRLAELRLWLEVVAADPHERPEAVRPLPNLDAMVRQGDSLVDPFAGLAIRPVGGTRAAELARLRTAVAEASGAAKRGALAALRRAEVAIAADGMGGAVTALDARIAELLESARCTTLFGGRRGLDPRECALLTELRATRQRVREQLRALARAGEVPWLHYPTHFADVFRAGGFDLVVGNPPWVRAEALDPALRRYLAGRFRWFRGARGGPRGYAHQPDLAVAFLERALELLAPDGAVAFVLPAKLATTGYARAAREELTRRTTIAVAADLRHDPRAAFDATVYPMALVAVHGPPAEGHEVRVRLGGPGGAVPQRALGADPWPLFPERAREAIARLERIAPRLGERYVCHLGVKTGLDRAFLDPPPEVEPALVRWAVRGRDVRAFRVRPVRRLLWPCDAGGRPLDALPAGAARHLAPWTGELRRRADHAGGHTWALFRTGPASAAYRVVWADLARRLEAAALIGRSGLALIPLNTCYVLPVRDAATAHRIAAWLNSTWCRAIAAASADPASGGYARFNARVVGALPLPPAALADDPLLALAQAGARGDPPQEELDARCAELLGLSESDRDALAELAAARAEPGR
jgi:Eco57I restriction-modification methylase